MSGVQPQPVTPEGALAPSASVVIVGAGHAGGATAIALRQAGFAGGIILLGEEPLAPYQRPPLSKAWLKGEADGASLLLKPLDWYSRNGIDLRLGVCVAGLDLGARRVRLDDGATLAFDVLVLAMGARARRLDLPGINLDGVLTLRSAADADRLKARLSPGARLAVIGGGYVGLECAASARALGAEAVVIEREPRLLARVACQELSDFYLARHAHHGVRFELAARVAALIGEEERLMGVRLADDSVIGCDIAVIGVGAQPNQELAEAAGLDCADGVVVDDRARTSAPGVYAVGDVARRPLGRSERLHRLESVPNALEQARQVAAAVTGRPAPDAETPWFWSDQYDVKLQIAGLSHDCDARVVRGRPDEGRFAVYHLQRGCVRAVEAVNAPADFMVAKRLIAAEIAVDPVRLADQTVPLKALV